MLGKHPPSKEEEAVDATLNRAQKAGLVDYIEFCTEYSCAEAGRLGGMLGGVHTKSPVLVIAYFGGEIFTKDEHVEKTFDLYHVLDRSSHQTSEYVVQYKGTRYRYFDL